MMVKTPLKNFKVSFRLQKTKAQTHPIQVLLNLQTKDTDGQYIRIIQQTGITIKDNEWNAAKGRPVDSKLNQLLVNLEAEILAQIEVARRWSNEVIRQQNKEGIFKLILLESVNKKLHGKPTSWDILAKDISPQSTNFHHVKDRIIQENLRLVNNYGAEIDLNKFFEYWGAFKGSELLKKGVEVQQTVSSGEVKIEDNDPNPIPFYQYIIQVAEKKIKRGDLKEADGYKALSKQFMEFDSRITIRLFNDNYAIEFLAWLRERLNTVNNYGKYIKNLKAVVNYALDEDRYKIDCRPRSSIYAGSKEEIIHPYLNEEQLDALAKLEFDEDEKDLEYCRDLALIASYSGGVRYGNWKQMFLAQKTKVEGQTVYFIESMSSKQGERKQIPLMDNIYQLLAKYEFRFRELRDDEFNINIKKICERAGMFDSSLTDDYLFYRKNLKTGQPEPVKKFFKAENRSRIPRLCDLVSSHTMRRSFATIFYYHRKIHAEIVMQFTGHTKLEDFLLYCKATDRLKFDDFTKKVVLKERNQRSTDSKNQ